MAQLTEADLSHAVQQISVHFAESMNLKFKLQREAEGEDEKAPSSQKKKPKGDNYREKRTKRRGGGARLLPRLNNDERQALIDAVTKDLVTIRPKLNLIYVSREDLNLRGVISKEDFAALKRTDAKHEGNLVSEIEWNVEDDPKTVAVNKILRCDTAFKALLKRCGIADAAAIASSAAVVVDTKKQRGRPKKAKKEEDAKENGKPDETSAATSLTALSETSAEKKAANADSAMADTNGAPSSASSSPSNNGSDNADE